jgi:hypothetical protein
MFGENGILQPWSKFSNIVTQNLTSMVIMLAQKVPLEE